MEEEDEVGVVIEAGIALLEVEVDEVGEAIEVVTALTEEEEIGEVIKEAEAITVVVMLEVGEIEEEVVVEGAVLQNI